MPNFVILDTIERSSCISFIIFVPGLSGQFQSISINDTIILWQQLANVLCIRCTSPVIALFQLKYRIYFYRKKLPNQFNIPSLITHGIAYISMNFNTMRKYWINCFTFLYWSSLLCLYIAISCIWNDIYSYNIWLLNEVSFLYGVPCKHVFGERKLILCAWGVLSSTETLITWSAAIDTNRRYFPLLYNNSSKRGIYIYIYSLIMSC